MDRPVDEQMTIPSREQMRARYPDECGYVQRDGVRVFYEAYGTGERAILFLPTWEIVHSRAWKFQIPYFARHGRVVTFDRRGNGRSDRPFDVGAYDRRAAVGDALAVLDKAGAGRVVVSPRRSGPDVVERCAEPVLCDPKVVAGLQVYPEPLRGAEIAGEPQCRVGADPALPVALSNVRILRSGMSCVLKPIGHLLV
jgi:hypothetical protein